MTTQVSTESSSLPKPHKCPWWIQYMLVSPLRRIVEPSDTLLGSVVQPGMTVLEAGCGFGYVTLAAASKVGPDGRVLAVDMEPRAVERLKKRAERAGMADRIDARACDGRDMGLSAHAGTVDVILVIHTLHEFEDLPGFLGQARELLAPGGRVWVVEPRGHVTEESFRAELAVCLACGFREVRPASFGKHMTVLLERDLP